ncbi:YigZ family protein [Mariniphaga sp.]|uniref:YigZ family protein n=1 Tax=Mariniphaga sp. TaxID=1954475 RepID=UPI0035615703
MDTYKTIKEKSEGLFKDKGSKFIAYAFPVETEEEIKELLTQLKKEHHSARHHCYAWRLGTEEITFRANDDGEPSSTAGKPILGQLLSFELTNTLIIVVRYFGGTLLGTSGLINAYRTAAAEAIKNAKIETRIIEEKFTLKFTYKEMKEVMQIIKQENLNITDTRFELDCELDFLVRKSDAGRIEEIFQQFYGVEIINQVKN